MALRSARVIGGLLLAVPLVAWLAGLFFPNYDARSRFFAGTFHNIVDAGDDYLIALALFLLMALILAALAVGLTRSPLLAEAQVLWVVIGGLGVSAFGFATAALTGFPVWSWASRVADGSESLGAMAARSETLASISQTVMLMFGLGGLLVAMSVLGVVAALRRWVSRVLFWGTVAVATAAIVWGALTSGPVIWLSIGGLPMLWAFVFGAVLLIRGNFGAHAST